MTRSRKGFEVLEGTTKFGVGAVLVRFLNTRTTRNSAGGTCPVRARGAGVFSLGPEIVHARPARKIVFLAIGQGLVVRVAFQNW